MPHPCANCTAAIADERPDTVCDACRRRWESDLRSLIHDLPALRLVAERKAHAAPPQPGPHGRRTSAPAPLDWGAYRLLRDVDGYAATLARAAGLPHAAATAESSLRGVVPRSRTLMAREDAGRIVRLGHEAARRVRRRLTPPDDRILIGMCLRCDGQLWCTEDDIAGGWTVCPGCGSTQRISDVRQARILRLAGYGAQGTAAALSRLFKSCGLRVDRKTISQWSRRGVISPVGDADGRPVFRLWDVWKAIRR